MWYFRHYAIYQKKNVLAQNIKKKVMVSFPRVSNVTYDQRSFPIKMDSLLYQDKKKIKDVNIDVNWKEVVNTHFDRLFFIGVYLSIKLF